ncbi:hypothetical protein C0J52_27724, partial [Blattella germanica]
LFGISYTVYIKVEVIEVFIGEHNLLLQDVDFVLIFLFPIISYARADVSCYVCTWSESNTACYDNVQKAGSKVSCPNFCGISRVDDVKANKMTAFARMCSNYETLSYVEHGGVGSLVQSCNTDLCNTMNGSGVCH